MLGAYPRHYVFTCSLFRDNYLMFLCLLLPRALIGKVERSEHEQYRQRVEEYAEQGVSNNTLGNSGFHFHVIT